MSMVANGASDLDALLDAFATEIGAALGTLRRFGRASLGYQGASDGVDGVQWNVWLDAREEAAFLGVNLEGMAYDGWPVARFIERELGVMWSPADGWRPTIARARRNLQPLYEWVADQSRA